ncbi:MAG: hypothetical protein JNK30_09630 [Phenylobacterium sp.]|uniref:hypothetical protein n=1 Tax=Phenylobacterium sp. TaxID=1871053 RepID=UPI001A416CED|nr:hypothetical protein [Phenylobacterium sp.]MBL8771629.1 hypothetical protein [Phenylobacterium sp.]
MDALKPYVMLACVAFVVGFMSYLVLAAQVRPSQEPVVAPVQQAPAATAPAFDANPGKHI